LDRVERTALISILINVGLVLLKVALAALSGSLALIADAWHSGSDVAASGLVWAGARISRRERRLNLAVVENVVGLVIGGLILWAAFGIFRRVSLAAGAPITNLAVAIGGALLAALVSYYAAQYKLHVGRETGSLSLIADGHHSRMDTLTTAAVVVGLLGHAIGIELDRIAAAVVAIFVVESALVILAAAIGGLREGTAASATPLAKLAESPLARAALGFLERIGISSWGRRVGRAFTTREGRRRAITIAIIAALVVWGLTAVYIVGPGRVGVVARWGKVSAAPAMSGIHLKAPWPVDRVTRLATSQVRRVELGFRTRTPTGMASMVAAEFYAALWESRHEAGTYEKRPEEALRLTGDENIVDMNLVIFYRVSDPIAYLFNVARTENLVLFAAESAATATTGSLAIEEILTLRRDELEETMATAVQELLDTAGAGIEIIDVLLQDMHPPLEVVPSFRDVASAREDKNRIINEALGYKNVTVPTARGDAERLLREAEGYRSERVGRAEGDSDRILSMAIEYRRAKDVTETRLYIEAMEDLLKNVEKFIVSSDIEVTGYDLRVFDKGIAADAVIE
jgi:membrane protease subunit HflK